MAKMMEVGDATFVDEVERSAQPVLVDFTAAWCAPCKALAPVLEELAGAWDGRVRFVSVDVDRHQATAERFGIRSMPTLLLFQRGRVVAQVVGAVSRGKLEETLRAVA